MKYELVRPEVQYRRGIEQLKDEITRSRTVLRTLSEFDLITYLQIVSLTPVSTFVSNPLGCSVSRHGDPFVVTSRE